MTLIYSRGQGEQSTMAAGEGRLIQDRRICWAGKSVKPAREESKRDHRPVPQRLEQMECTGKEAGVSKGRIAEIGKTLSQKNSV